MFDANFLSRDEKKSLNVLVVSVLLLVTVPVLVSIWDNLQFLSLVSHKFWMTLSAFVPFAKIVVLLTKVAVLTIFISSMS